MTHVKSYKRKRYLKNLIDKLNKRQTDYTYYKLERLFDKKYGRVFKPKKPYLNKMRKTNKGLKSKRKSYDKPRARF